MASTNFNYSPTTGNGNTNVSVSAVANNTTTSDYVATLTFSNGANSKSVTIRQKYKPYVLQGPTSVPASGGSIYITAMTEYDIVFRSVPLWISNISANGVVYSEGQRIPASISGTPIMITAEPNTGSARSTVYADMNMSWYVGDTLVTLGAPRIELYQAAAESGINTDVDSLTFDYNANVAQTIQVLTNSTWSSTINDN